MIPDHEVVSVLDALAAAGVDAWVDGGWGVDALLGEQTRDHADLDLVVALGAVDAVQQALAPLGYEMTQDERPTHSEDGVDLTLIRWMLSLTPAERLQVLQQTVRSIGKVRDANES